MAKKIHMTAEQFYAKYSSRLTAAVNEITDGVKAVTESPTAAAAAKQDKMRAGILAAIDNGKWAAALKAVSLEEWKSRMLNVGIPRIQAGVDASKSKVETFAKELLSYESTLQQKIASMPDTNLEQRIQRATAWMQGMSKFKKTSG